jgi:PAS domain S-box-containing protein
MDKELRILILEDVPADAELEEHELRKAGLVFITKVVDTKEAFLKALEEFLPDIILSDYDLPAFDGFAALRIAKEKSPDVPFILVTGKLGEEFAIEKLKEGAKDYVLKNNLKRLVPSVNRALEEAKQITDYKRAEKSLRNSEAFLNNIIEQSPYSIWISDEKGTLTRLNQACRNLLHIKDEDVLGKYNVLKDNIVEEQGLMPLVKSVFEQGRTVRFNLEYDSSKLAHPPLKDTIFLALDVTIFPIKDLKGKVTNAVIQHIDITDKKLAEEALSISEEKYRSLIENQTELVSRFTPDGTFIFVNDVYCHFFGKTKDELIGKKWFPIPIDEDLTIIQGKLQTLSPTNPIAIIENRVVSSKGDIHWMQFVNRGFFDLHGNLMEIQSVGRDITERKRAEEELRLNESRLSSLLELSRMTNQPIQALTEFTLEKAIELTRSTIGYLSFLNEDETVLTMYSWSRQSMQECMIQQKPLVYPVETTGLWGEAVRQRKPVITNDYQAPNPLKKGYPEGHVHVTRHMNIPLFDGDKIVIVAGVGNKAEPYDDSDIQQLTILMDGMWKIIKRKQIEDTMRESEEKYHSLMDNASDAILLADMDGNILEVNRKAGELLGYTKDELMTMNFPMIHPSEELERTAEAFKEIILKGFTYLRDGIVLRKDGETVPVDITGSLIAYGDKLVAQGIFRDITERKRAEQEKRKIEEQLYQSQKIEAVGQLAGGIAHDFNNILTAMIGYGHLLKIKLKEEDPLRNFVDQILSLSDKAANLTKSLLAFSRKQIIDPRPVDLNEIIKRTDHLLSRIIGEDIQLRTALSERDLIVMADPGQIEHVLMNLATNARDAMPKGGLLNIGTETINLGHEFIKEHGFGKEGEYAHISVTDTGVGMDRKTREKIFEPFFTTKEIGKGTGLGLAMAYGIIKQHEGYINVYSEPGKGTTFRIYLPLIQAQVEEIKPEAIQTIEKGTETVLLAEDGTEVREITKRLLEDNGYNVITAADGQEAINEFMVHKNEIQLVLLDVIMPNKNGKEVYDEIKQIKPDIKVLFMSGYPADVIHLHGILEKGFAYIEKPCSPAKLLRKAREVLGK